MIASPLGWTTAHIPEIADVYDSRRVPLNGAERSTRKGPYPYYGANGQVDFIFEGPHVLLAEDGGFFDQPERGVAYPVDGRFWVNNHAHILKPAGGISCGFLHRLLNSVDWMPYVGGTTRAKLTQAALGQPVVPVPPVAEQRRIVAKIDALSARSKRARADLDRVEALAARAKQAVLAAAFDGQLVDGDTDENWIPGPLSRSILDLRYGTAKKCERTGQTPVLRIPNVQRGRIELADLKYADFDPRELETLGLAEGDILIIRSNGSVGLVGRAAVVEAGTAGMAFAGYLIRLRLDPARADPHFIRLMLASPTARTAIERAAKSTSGVNNINSREIEALSIPLPPIALQRETVERAAQLEEKIDALVTEVQRANILLDRLDQSVLAKAFRGELVPQDPTDEPAKVLIDRIRAERTAAGASPKRRGRKAAGTSNG